MNVEFLNFSCHAPPPLVKHYNCEFHELSTSRYVFNIDFELSRKLPEHAMIAIMVHFKARDSQRVVKFIDLKLKICDVLGNINTLPVVKKVLDSLMQNSNLPMSCPIKGNFPYRITNLTISDENMIKYIPAMHFNITLIFSDRQKQLGKVLAQGLTEARG
ncbi:uncharacterized protein LOC131804005 [Musca domestica]|uniref:Uncharacterized protein LOC131804005 n=1 Tax=Musca domestica TaxID=7370 RepID=A0ABM3V8J6_MUSDO|nr:uncharacterized protein LOC131804005 [Musca domestica]